MKKLIILIGGGILAIVLIILLITSLTGKKTTNTTTTLNFLTYSEDIKGLQTLVAPFEKSNNVKVNFVKKSLTNYELESLNMISTNQIDIWGIPNSWVPKHLDKLSSYNYDPVTNNLDTNAVAYYQNLYLPSVVLGNMFNNKIYAFPLSMDALVLFSNNLIIANATNDDNPQFTRQQKQLFSEAPANWADLTERAKLLTQKSGGNISQSGLAIGTADLPEASDVLTLLMLQYGAQMNNDARTEAIFHTSINKFGGPAYPAEKAVEFYTSFAKKDNPNYSFSGDALKAFTEGKVAYYIDYASRASDFSVSNPSLAYTIGPVPQLAGTGNPVSFISYETLTVPKNSKNQLLAWGLLGYLTSPENYGAERYYEDTGRISIINTNTYNHNPIVFGSAQSAGYWYNPEATETDKIFRQVISDVLSGANAQTALEAAAVKVTNLLKKIQ